MELQQGKAPKTLPSTLVDGLPYLLFEGAHAGLGELRQARPALRRGMKFKAERLLSLGTSANPASSAAMG